MCHCFNVLFNSVLFLFAEVKGCASLHKLRAKSHTFSIQIILSLFRYFTVPEICFYV